MAQSPPTPPQIRQQQQSPSPMMMAAQQQGAPQGGGAGQGSAEMIGQLDQKIQELEKWTSDMNMILSSVHPPLKALLGPIAQVGKALQQETTELKKRAGAQGQQSAGGQQGGGAGAGGADTPNPAEGAAADMAA